MIIEIPRDATCHFEGCARPASHIAQGLPDWDDDPPAWPAPAAYCEPHAREVAGEGRSEYLVDCPNCGCLFGVG
jgi:hypothetical protein